MLNLFSSMEIPMVGKVALIVLGALFALFGVIWTIRTFIGIRRHLRAGWIATNAIAAILVLVAAFIGLSMGINSQPKTADVTEPPATEETQAPEETSEPEPATEPEELPETAFYVNLSDEDLLVWLAEQFGADFDLYNDVRIKFDNSSLPSQLQKRIAATKEAMTLYYGKEMPGFNDPVAFPMTELIEMIKSDAWKGMSEKEQQNWFRENVTKEYVYMGILRNPVYADMWVSWLLEYAKEFPVITERSPWLNEFKAKLDSWYSSVSEPVGLQNCFDPIRRIGDPKVFTQEYTLYCAKLIYVMDGFTVSANPVQGLTSRINWHLPLTGDANLTRVAECPEQEKEPALVFEYRYKSGNTAMKAGANIFDGRAEIFEPQEPVKETPQEPQKGDPETPPTNPPTDPPSNPPKTPTYTLTILYKYEDGSKAANDYTATLKQGATYSVNSPTIQGYTPDRSVVSGTMPGKNHTEVVTYRQQQIGSPSFKLTILYKYEDGSKAAADYTANLRAGETYNVNSPVITGYTPDRSVVSGTMPSGDVTETVIYRKDYVPPTTYNLVIHYVYSTGGQAAADHTEKLEAGKAYNVDSPKIQGWTPDQAKVSGTMPAQDVAITVTYFKDQTVEKEYNLTIHYVYSTGGKAADDYTAKLKSGQAYSKTSPSIQGWKPDQATVSGTMPSSDVVVTVTYYKEQVVENKYTLTINYIYENGSKAANSYTAQLKKGESYSVNSPAISGYTPDKATVSGTMPADNVSVTVTYKAVSHKLTILYKYKETGGTAATTHTATLKYGESYSVNSPTIQGYTADRPVVSGTMGAQDITETVYYTKNAAKNYTLTIRYVYEATGNQASPTYTGTYAAGATYSVTSPTISGYTADPATVSGTMPERDVHIDVLYKAHTHQLTIYYKYENGGTAASTYKHTYSNGEYYSVASPVINGYTSDIAVVQGMMGDRDITVTVTYKQTPPDGQGGKDPGQSNGEQNPEHPGDDLNPGDGTGDYQPTEPPVTDTPPEGSNNNGGNGGNTTPPAGDDHRQEVNETPITPSDPEDSSGLGGQDHPIQDENGGSTDNGTPPDKDPIPVVTDTTVTDTDSEGNQTTTGTGDDPVNTGTILPPD